MAGALHGSMSLVAVGFRTLSLFTLRRCIMQCFSGCQVGPDQPLMEAGLDSLGAVELRSALCAKFGIELPATLTFDHPSITAISSYVSSVLPAPEQHAQPAQLAAHSAAVSAVVEATVAALLGVVNRDQVLRSHAAPTAP